MMPFMTIMMVAKTVSRARSLGPGPALIMMEAMSEVSMTVTARASTREP